MKHSANVTSSGASPVMHPAPLRAGGCRIRRFSGLRRFASILSLAIVCTLFTACNSAVDSAGTIPRSDVRAPSTPHRLLVTSDMLFEFGENTLERKTVNIPKGEYVFEGEDDIFLYFRSPEEMEYRVYHKENYAEGAFQLGGLALARKEQWDKVEYPACTYIDGKDQHQKRLTCPIGTAFLLQKRGTDWESDFDAD